MAAQMPNEPQTEPLFPEPQPNSSRRPKEPLFTVYGPDGQIEQHTRQNMRDLCRLHGWSEHPPGPPPPSPYPVAVETGPEVQGDLAASSRGHLAKAVVSRLKPLREEAAAWGIEVDNRWGVKRLQQEIEDVKKKPIASP